jgi:hypothetical protein
MLSDERDEEEKRLAAARKAEADRERAKKSSRDAKGRITQAKDTRPTLGYDKKQAARDRAKKSSRATTAKKHKVSERQLKYVRAVKDSPHLTDKRRKELLDGMLNGTVSRPCALPRSRL